MPQYNTPSGPVRFPDEKSLFPTSPRVGFGQAVAIGLGTGVLGAFAMAITSKLEQTVTHRPNSYVPALTLSTWFNIPSFYRAHPDITNWIHHVGMGAIAAPIRAAMSYYGIIGPMASFMYTGIRIFLDQVVEIGADVSRPPWTWPINEQVVDLVHKSVYGIVVGYLCDRYVRGVDWFN